MAACDYQKQITKSLRFIDDHYSEDITLADISEAACFSPYHFHRIFTSIIRETPGDYLRRIRLEKAANLLRNRPDQSITEIAMSTGFSSSSVFSRAFRLHFHRSPSRIRKEKQIPESYRSSLSANDLRPEPVEPEFRDLPEMRLICKRSRGGYGPEIGKTWKTLYVWASEQKLLTGNSLLFGIPLDDPDITANNNCRYLAAIAAGEKISVPDSFEELRVPASIYASFRYSGPFSGLQTFYNRVYGHWLPACSFLIKDQPSLECYDPPEGSISSIKRPQNTVDFQLLLPVEPH